MKIITEIQDFNEASEKDSLDLHESKIQELVRTKLNELIIPLLTLLMALKPLIIALLKFAKIFTKKAGDEKIDKFIALLESF